MILCSVDGVSAVFGYLRDYCHLSSESIVTGISSIQTGILLDFFLGSFKAAEFTVSAVQIVEESYLSYLHSIGRSRRFLFLRRKEGADKFTNIPFVNLFHSKHDGGLEFLGSTTHLFVAYKTFTAAESFLNDTKESIKTLPHLEYIVVFRKSKAPKLTSLSKEFVFEFLETISFQVGEMNSLITLYALVFRVLTRRVCTNHSGFHLSRPRNTSVELDLSRHSWLYDGARLFASKTGMLQDDAYSTNMSPEERSARLSYKLIAEINASFCFVNEDDTFVTTDFLKYETYVGCSGREVDNFKCTISFDNSNRKRHWAQVQYCGEQTAKLRKGDFVTRVKVVDIFNDYSSVPDFYPQSALFSDVKDGLNIYYAMDLGHPFSYIHDCPTYLRSKKDSYFEVAGTITTDQSNGEIYVSFVTKSNFKVKKGSLVFYVISEDLERQQKSAHEHHFLSAYERDGWRWADFVVYHRGKIDSLPESFKVIKFPSHTFDETSGWCSSLLRVKQEKKKGWGVITLKSLSPEITVVPFAGFPLYGRDYEEASKKDPVRSYSMCYKDKYFGCFGFDAYNSGTIARYMNHSCNGNMLAQFTPHQGGYFTFSTENDVPEETFLTYDYGGSKVSEGCLCSNAINFKHVCDRRDPAKRSKRSKKTKNQEQGSSSSALTCTHQNKYIEEALEGIPEIAWLNVKIEKQVGKSGSFGSCYKCNPVINVRRRDGLVNDRPRRKPEFVVKIFNRPDRAESIYCKGFLKELSASKILNEYDNFPSAHYYSKRTGRSGQLAVIYDFVGPFTLKEANNLIQKKGGTWKEKWLSKLKLCENVLYAVLRMHRKGIVHNDLHLGNVLFNKEYEVFIIDFGKATSTKTSSEIPFVLHPRFKKCFHSKLTPTAKYSSTYYWIAPESAECSQQNHFSSDMVGVGFLLIRILFGLDVFNFTKNIVNARVLPFYFHDKPHHLQLPFQVEALIPQLRKYWFL